MGGKGLHADCKGICWRQLSRLGSTVLKKLSFNPLPLILNTPPTRNDRYKRVHIVGSCLILGSWGCLVY